MNSGRSELLPAQARIFVVDDHPLLREGVRHFFDQLPDVVVCGEAGDAMGTFEGVAQSQPDLVLLDLRLGRSDALDLIKSLRSRFPRVRILVYSQHDEMIYAERTLRAGANGYIMKNESPAEMLTAVRRVMRGEIYVSPTIAAKLVQQLVQGTPTPRQSAVVALSDRELQVFQMLGAGMSSRQIAESLHLSIKTVETYRENIKHKLGLANAAELMRHATQWALEQGSNGLQRVPDDPARLRVCHPVVEITTSPPPA